MAELLARWLNEEIQLSQPVKDFEQDFASGYLFGELLYKFNQQSNFSEFSTKDNISTKVKNFEKLEPTLRNLRIKFDSQQVDKIMKSERGYALRLLYQLKMILEKVYPPTDIAILRKTGKVGDNQPALKIGSAKESYNQMQSQFFKTRLQALNKPQKTMNMEEHLKKFDNEAERQDEEAKRHYKNEKEEGERIKQEIRRAQINKLQRNAGFMEEWLQKGVEDWKQNMTYKKEREQSQLEFEYKQAHNFNETTVNKIEEATKEVNDGINQFEKTLQQNGINPRVTKDNADKALKTFSSDIGSPAKATMRTQKMALSLLARPTMGLGGTMTKTGGITLASVGLRSKAKKPLDDKARKDKERRRMRMITDQMTLLHDIEGVRREGEVINRMKLQAKQEEELAYESWRTNQCRSVIVENRKLREAKYDKRQDLDTQNSVFKEKQMLDSMQEQMKREIDTLALRDDFMREKDKEAKKLRQTVECQKMIEAIFDIAEVAYTHQQKQDSNQIDPRNWNEWQQLFIQGAPIIEDSDAPASSHSKEYVELLDYINNTGQWPTTIVSENKPNIQQILSGSSGDPVPVAKGKAPAKGAAEVVVLEESEMQVNDKPENNYFVGDAIEKIINLNYEARGKQLRPKNPHYLNLKLCFVGYSFGGKRLQAMKLKEEYGLDTFTLSDLVEEALKYFQDHPHPSVKEVTKPQILEVLNEESKDELKADQQDVPPSPQKTSRMEEGEKSVEGRPKTPKLLRENPLFQKSVVDLNAIKEEVLSEASEIEEELDASEDFRQCGEKIQTCLFNGDEISDQLYVELYVAKLRITYECKDRQQLKNASHNSAKRELELTRQIENLKEEIEQRQNPDNKVKKSKKRTNEFVLKELQDCEAELESIQNIDKNGWILIDFPTNFGQAMLLEKALSGYQIPGDLEPTQREIENQEAQLLVKPTERPAPPKTLIPSGIDAVIWFDCSRDECLRRALGRRIDSQTGIVYHIEDNKPSIEKSPLCEIIEPIDDESESMSCLVDRWVAFDQTRDGLQKWLTQFGDESTKTNLLSRIEASGDIPSVYEQIDNVLKDIVDKKITKQALLRRQIQSKLIIEEEIEAEKLRAAQEEEDKQKKKAEADQDGAAAEDDAKSAGKSQNRSQVAVSQKSVRGDNSTQLTTIEGISNERSNIDNDFKGVLMGLWKRISSNYKSQMIKVLKKQRVQREEIEQQFFEVQKQFLTFLKRLDGKQLVLDKFIEEFNKFSNEYPDMREDDQTKEELHQRCDILSDELWEIAEDRKEQAVEERKKIMESGWVEYSLEYLTTCAGQMMQSEIDKFKGTIQLVHDYYHAIDEKLIPEAPEQSTIDILAETEGHDLPDIEKLADGSEPTDFNSYSYPRLDDFFKKALKAQIVPDISFNAGSFDATKKGAKKEAPKKTKDEGDEHKPESIYVKEMKEAIKVEKSILRFRLSQVRNWALMRLKHQRELSLRIYQKLDDWINVSSKAENDAIDEVCDIIKISIEEQTKIQDELRINFMDFFADKKILNYIEPPPEKLAMMEESIEGKFNIPQLKGLIIELRLLANRQGKIINRQVVELFLRKSKGKNTLGDVGGLPAAWNEFVRNDFERIVRNLDIYNSGSIDYKVLATYCILLKSPVANDHDIDQLKKSLFNNEISCQTFLAQNPWFVKTEATKDREYSHPYPRANHIKQILFDLHSENDNLNVSKLATILRAAEITMLKQGSITSYGDILTSPIKK